jgi:hypothetical protein
MVTQKHWPKQKEIKPWKLSKANIDAIEKFFTPLSVMMVLGVWIVMFFDDFWLFSIWTSMILVYILDLHKTSSFRSKI